MAENLEVSLLANDFAWTFDLGSFALADQNFIDDRARLYVGNDPWARDFYLALRCARLA